MLFHHLEHTREQFGLWRNLDSIAQLNLQKMQLRMSQGDVSALALNDSKKIAADIHRQYQQLQQLYESDALSLGAWMGIAAKVYPAEQTLETVKGLISDINLSMLPSQKLAQAQVEMSYQAWRMAKTQRLPQLQLGWVQQSFQGFQQLPSGDQFFDRSMQFSQYQVGLRIPVLGSNNRKQAQGKALEYQAALMNQQFMGEQANLRYEQLKMALVYWDEQILQYKEVLLPAAAEQVNLLSLQRDKGEISDMEWGMYMREVMQTQIDYYQAVHEWESVQIELQYFNPNNQ